MMTQPILPQKELKVKDIYLPSGCIKRVHEILRSIGICDLQLIDFDLCTEIKNIDPFIKVVQQAIEASIQEAGEQLQSIPSDEQYLWTIGRFACHFVRILEDLKVAGSSILTSETLTVALDLFSELYLNTFDVRFGIRRDIAVSTCKFVSILAQLSELITHGMLRSLHQLVRQREGRERDYWFLLLTTCTYIPTADVTATVRLLLKVGADANARDKEGNNALHRLAWKWFETEQLEESLNVVVGELIKSGTHPDQLSTVTYLGKVKPTDIWKTRHDEGRILPSCWRPVPSLACLSTRSLKHSGKPYDETSLPVTLQAFVAMH